MSEGSPPDPLQALAEAGNEAAIHHMAFVGLIAPVGLC